MELRAEYSRWIYWFTDTGIARVETISLTPLLGSAVAIAILLTITILSIAVLGIGIPIEVLLIAFAVGFGLVIAFPLLVPEIIRNRLLRMPLEELLRREGSIMIPWGDVQGATSYKGMITFSTKTANYHVFTRKNQKAIEDFMRTRIGERLST